MLELSVSVELVEVVLLSDSDSASRRTRFEPSWGMLNLGLLVNFDSGPCPGK